MITGASVASEMGDEQAEPANGSDPGRSGGGGR
jgi:hypothetical protein